MSARYVRRGAVVPLWDGDETRVTWVRVLRCGRTRRWVDVDFCGVRLRLRAFAYDGTAPLWVGAGTRVLRLEPREVRS